MRKLNYRGVTLGCSVAKVFMREMARRLGRFAEDRILTEAQGGFRSHKRCSDQWLVLRGVYGRERRRHHNLTSWMLARHMTVCGGRGCGVRGGIMI